MKSKFSVLLSVYHREKADFLRDALKSVFEQTVVPSEVVLVKDGPLNEELNAIVADFEVTYNTLKVVALPQNVGLGNALNEGLKHCTCGLVARMDSDDICKPNRFERQLEVFAHNPTLSIVGSWVDEFEENPSNVVSVRSLPETSAELKKYATSRNPLNHPSVMFVKKDVMSVGGYLHFYLFEDYYLWVRMLYKQYQLYNIQESLLYYRTNADMIARRGGWKYAVSETKFFIEMYKKEFIGIPSLIKNIVIRFPVRVAPNKMRAFVYNFFLR